MIHDSAKPKVKWACPKCGAVLSEHGKGGASRCKYTCGRPGECGGFLCGCDDTGDDTEHGTTYDKVCNAADCSHCGWSGVFPQPPGKMPPWAKRALAAGWSPPKGQMP